MKILVTGGAGFIGSHVVDAFIKKGHDVVVVDNLSSGKRENVNPKAKFYEADITDLKRLKEIFEAEKPDVIDHHAAQISVVYSVENPQFDAHVNIIGSLNLIDLALKYHVKKFIYASTGGAIYGEPAYLPCDEKHPVDPLAPYGISKHSVEHYLYMTHVNFGLDYTVLRYANIYGPRQDPYGEAGVVAIFSRRMLEGEEAHIFGDGYQERDFVFVKDVADANLLALDFETEIKNSLDPIFNVGTGVGTNVNTIFNLIKKFTGYKGEPVYKPPRPGEVYKIYLDNKKIQSVMGWKPSVDLEEGLRLTVEWFKTN